MKAIMKSMGDGRRIGEEQRQKWKLEEGNLLKV
jgi:hypothetical protein